MVVGLDGEDGLDVQRPVEVDQDQGQGHVTIPVHNMEGIIVEEFLTRLLPVTLIPVQVSNQGKVYAK